jgi:hypothetical protein
LNLSWARWAAITNRPPLDTQAAFVWWKVVKFSLVFRKIFSFYFGQKTLSGSYEKFRNIILFVNYIKFDHQTFNCYIYFVLNICFSISSLKI